MLHTLLKLATDNPGQYVPAGTVSTINSPIFWGGLLAGFIVLAACLAIASDDGEPGIAIIGFLLYAGIVAGGHYLAQQSLEEPSGATAAEYDKSVTGWLDDTYGIHVSAEDASELRAGESIAVEFDGNQVVIEFVKTADSDDLAVRATGGQLLTPLTAAE